VFKKKEQFETIELSRDTKEVKKNKKNLIINKLRKVKNDLLAVKNEKYESTDNDAINFVREYKHCVLPQKQRYNHQLYYYNMHYNLFILTSFEKQNLKYDVKAQPLDYFDGMLFIILQLELYSATNNTDIKLYNLFPVTKTCIPGSIIIDTVTLLRMFKPDGYAKVLSGEGSLSVNSIKTELWSNYFKLDRKEFNSFQGKGEDKDASPQYKFGHSIMTDGVSICIIHTRADIESRKVLVSEDGDEDSDEDEDYGPVFEYATDGNEMEVVAELLPTDNAYDDCEMMLSGDNNADNSDIFTFASLARNGSENDYRVVLKLLNCEFERSNMVPLQTNILFAENRHLLSDQNQFNIVLHYLRRNGLIHMTSIATSSSDIGHIKYNITKGNYFDGFIFANYRQIYVEHVVIDVEEEEDVVMETSHTVNPSISKGNKYRYGKKAKKFKEQEIMYLQDISEEYIEKFGLREMEYVGGDPGVTNPGTFANGTDKLANTMIYSQQERLHMKQTKKICTSSRRIKISTINCYTH